LGKRITVEDIAKQLEISSMTVSRALNNRPGVSEEMRKRIIDTAKELGYRPNQIAKSLVLKKTYTIGIVIPKMEHFFFPEALRGIEDVSYEHGYHLILTHSNEDRERESIAIQTLEAKRVDGILISVSEAGGNIEEYQNVVKAGLPIVFFDRCVFGIGASCVHINDEGAARLVTEHLINHEYKRIAHLRGPEGVSIGKERFNGYKKALEEYNLEYNAHLVVESGFNDDGGYQAMNKLLNLPRSERPDAVVAVNDPCAFGAIKSTKQRGLKIPDDIAIVGFTDDPRASIIDPPLTTIRQHAYTVGKTAARQLLTQIEEESDEIENITVDAELVVRRSCGCLGF